VGMYNS